MYRGRSLGRDYVVFLATASGKTIHVDSGPDYWVPPELRAPSRVAAGIIAELRIEWPLGIGHADAFIVETGTIVEVLSSAHASEEMTHSKLLQAAGYMAHYEPAKNLALIVLNPSDFSEEKIVVAPGSRRYTDLMDEVDARLITLDAWRRDDTIPNRVCRKPSEARGRFCLHAEFCFQDWEPTPVEELAAAPDVVEAVQTFATVKAHRARLASEDRALETQQKEAQAVLEQAELPADVLVAGYHVTRTDVQRKPTFQWENAEGAGVFNPDAYPEFFKAGAAYSTFKVEETADAETPDYGEVPF